MISLAVHCHAFAITYFAESLKPVKLEAINDNLTRGGGNLAKTKELTWKKLTSNPETTKKSLIRVHGKDVWASYGGRILLVGCIVSRESVTY